MSQNQKTEICLSLTIEDRELKKLVVIVGLGLWYLMPLSTKFQFYRSVLLVEETGVPGDNHRPVACH